MHTTWMHTMIHKKPGWTPTLQKNRVRPPSKAVVPEKYATATWTPLRPIHARQPIRARQPINARLPLPGLALLLGALAMPPAVTAAPEIPGAPQRQPVVLVGVTLHPVASPPIQDGMLLMEDGQIKALGRNVSVPDGALRIEFAGKHIYPALFDAYTDLGLVEIGAVRATRDQSETGRVNPNVKSWVSINPDSELIPVTRSNGVLLALTAPAGGLLAGQSAVIQLDGWTYEDITLRPAVGMHVDWPATYRGGDSGKRLVKQLEEAFDDARAYRRARSADESQHAPDLRWEALLSVLDGRLPLIVSADELQQLQEAVAFKAAQQVKLIIHGGYDAPLCSELLVEHDVPVIVGGVYRLPRRRDEPYDTPFTVPARLQQAGVRFCISGEGGSGASNVRNLPYHAAMASAFGLPRDAAIRSITLAPAEILGVADRVGSLEPGKDATLIVTDGDPLETPTQVEACFVQGRPVELDDRHKRLWRKYQEKYRRAAADAAAED